MLRIGLTLLLSILPVTVFGQEGKEDAFQKGLAAYQKRQYAEALTHFESLLQEDPPPARVLHNLALTRYQLNQKAYALALWRKALAVDPGFTAARAGRDLLESRFGMRPLERSSVNAGVRRALEYLSLYEVLWLTAVSLALAGWLALRYFAQRRAALDEELPLPPFPTTTVLAGGLLALCISLSALKVGHVLNTRATVVADKASARSLPAEDGVTLFEVNGGNEVLVKRSNEGWSQVQNSEGGTGWVKNAEILVTI